MTIIIGLVWQRLHGSCVTWQLFCHDTPGLYLAVTNFHTQILPTPLLLSFWEARIGVPFPAALEVILMEISFELLREAGSGCLGQWEIRSELSEV